jgi:uncharacterized membrane protein YGL010W
MSGLFRRQLADYVEYHRDPWNSVMHVYGILSLFLAAILPLSSVHIAVFGVETSLAVFLALPVLIYWILLDTALGVAILAAAIALLSVGTMIVDSVSTITMWSIFAALAVSGVASQIIGHQVFERRQPALIDNPSHLLLGPMFVMAKLFIALGFRGDLAAIIAPTPSAVSPS